MCSYVEQQPNEAQNYCIVYMSSDFCNFAKIPTNMIFPILLDFSRNSQDTIIVWEEGRNTPICYLYQKI